MGVFIHMAGQKLAWVNVYVDPNASVIHLTGSMAPGFWGPWMAVWIKRKDNLLHAQHWLQIGEIIL
jgi:hypothetical protein